MPDLRNATDRELLAYAISSSMPGELTQHDGDAADMLNGIAQELGTLHHAVLDAESDHANTILAIQARVRVVGELLRREGAPEARQGDGHAETNTDH